MTDRNKLKAYQSYANTRNTTEDETEYIDLSSFISDLFTIIKKRFFILLLVLIATTGGATAYAEFMIPKTYSSTASIFLTPYVSVAGVVDSSSQASNNSILANVMDLMTEDVVMNAVAKELNMSSASAVKGCLSVTNDEGTTIIRISATTTSPKLSKQIVNTTATTFIDKMKDNLNLKNIEIVSKGKLSYSPVGPNVKKYMLYGAALGVCLDGLYVLFKLFTDNRIKSKKNAEEYFKIPVFCELPEIKE